MVGGVSFTQVGLARPTDRLVQAGDGGFKAAGSGSLGGRIVNALKETFFPGTVRTENRQAYQAVRAEWGRQHGGETRAVREFFDTRLASGERFDASARDRLLGLPALSYDLASAGEASRSFVEAALAGMTNDAAKDTRTSVPGRADATLCDQLIADLPRATYTLNDAPLMADGCFVPTGERLDASAENQRSRLAERVGGTLVDTFGAHYADGISRYAHQGLASAVSFLTMGDDTPLRLPDGTPVQLPGADPNYAIHLSRNGNGSAHIQCDVGFSIEKLKDAGMSEQHPLHSLSDDSAAMFSYGFDLVRDDATGAFRFENVTPISFAAAMRPRVAA